MDRIKTAVKNSETKRRGSIPQIKKTAFSQSVSSPIDHILFLQRTIGNQAVLKLLERSGVGSQGSGVGIQAKLRIGQPGDVYEQGGYRVAEQIMQMPEPQIQPKPT